MNTNIRNYKKEDFNMINDWWKSFESTSLLPNMMLEDDSFILEYNKLPVLTVTIYYTKSKEIAFLEHFIGNPEFKNQDRKILGKLLLDFCENKAKENGYKRLIAFSYKEKIKNRYKELGLIQTLDNLSSFVKEF